MSLIPENAKEISLEGATVPFYEYEENGVSYIQFDTDLRKNLSITGSARYDVHEYFGEFLSPKLALVKDKFLIMGDRANHQA